MDLGPPELIIILVIVLVLFGGAKLPQLARSLGQAKKEFESAGKGESSDQDATKDADSDDKKATPTPKAEGQDSSS